MKLIGLTGGISCGKSTVSRLLRNEYGAAIIDCDEIARWVVEKVIILIGLFYDCASIYSMFEDVCRCQ